MLHWRGDQDILTEKVRLKGYFSETVLPMQHSVRISVS